MYRALFFAYNLSARKHEKIYPAVYTIHVAHQYNIHKSSCIDFKLSAWIHLLWRECHIETPVTDVSALHIYELCTLLINFDLTRFTFEISPFI